MIPVVNLRSLARHSVAHPAAIALLAAALVILSAAPAPSQTGKGIKPGFTQVWSRSVEPVIAIALSPKGGYVGMITRGGKLALWSAEKGAPMWSLPSVPEHNLVVSDKTGYVLVYDQMNRLDRTLTVYRTPALKTPLADKSMARPDRVFRRTLDGAVWAAAVSNDSNYAACGTGSRQVYLLDLTSQPRMTRYPIDGICNDLKFADDNSYMAIGLWNQSGVETMDMDGRIQGSPSGANDRRYTVSISPDSRHILTVSTFNSQSSNPVVSLLDDQGTVLWSRELGKTAYAPAIALGANSQISFASYTITVRRGHNMLPERILTAIGPKGDPLWTQRGGPFLSLTLIGLSPDGSGLVAYDGNRTLFRLNSDGQVIAHDKLSAPLQYWASDTDHKRLLVYTSDGALSLISLE